LDEAYWVNQFGDRPQLANELAQLVLAGTKTATCSALWELEREHWKYFSRVLPHLGQQPTPDMLLVCERFRVIYQSIVWTELGGYDAVGT
jgi:uncharacterized protein YhfF